LPRYFLDFVRSSPPNVAWSFRTESVDRAGATGMQEQTIFTEALEKEDPVERADCDEGSRAGPQPTI
jgi:hypothetical protein